MSSGPVSGVQVACELAEMGAHMVEATFRRLHPAASDHDVAEHVRSWWIDRPGAPDGDAIGTPRRLDPAR
jgi:Rv0078B-related antitoxin